MNENNFKCVFCGGSAPQKAIKFSLKTLQKCVDVLEYRRSKPVFRQSRGTYDDLELSMEASLNDLYHATCYKLFTAIKIPREYLQDQSEVAHENTPEVSGNSSEILASDSGEYSEAHGTVDSLSTEVAGTSTDE